MGRSAKIRHRRRRRQARRWTAKTAAALKETLEYLMDEAPYGTFSLTDLILDSLVIKDDGLYAQAGFKSYTFIKFNG